MNGALKEIGKTSVHEEAAHTPMENPPSSTRLSRVFDRIVLDHPLAALFMLLAAVSFFGYHAKDFRLDASAETLLLENDKDLLYARQVDARYRTQDFLLIAYTPKVDLFSGPVLAELGRMCGEIRRMDMAASVVSILEAPLLKNPPVPINALIRNIKTLSSPDVDKSLAMEEIGSSPLYRNLLVSPDLKTTAVQINLKPDAAYNELTAVLETYRLKMAQSGLTDEEQTAYRNLSAKLAAHLDRAKDKRHRDIAALRTIMAKYRSDADMFLGGVGMIADDLITFVKNDLKIFGVSVLLFLVATLGIIFRRLRWIVLSVCCCAFSVITMMGILGLAGWKVTVISSNFISLQLILTMSLTIHITIRYLEIAAANPDITRKDLVLNSVRTIITPSFYCNLTTTAGFGSLVLCNIRPVITFGWMMVAGLVISFVITFWFYPAALMLLARDRPRKGRLFGQRLTAISADLAARRRGMVFTAAAAIGMLSVFGISKLEVENSFINYFKKTTEIYRGMALIDEKLGGTTPFDVIVHLAENKSGADAESPASTPHESDVFVEFSEFDAGGSDEKYWFTADKMRRIKTIHQSLEHFPGIGKVISLGTLVEIAEGFNKGKPLDNFELALLYTQLPETFKEMALTPYVSIRDDEVRFAARVKDSEKTLKRHALLKEVRSDLTGRLGLGEDDVHLSGLLVLYNNMLQGLFHSQIQTIGFTMAALCVMFLILFRSLKIALIAVMPSAISIGAVLGLMGWANLPLDVMTITIASISVGIAVDDTIHYIHRFRKEISADGDYILSLYRCHSSIGYAMVYTTVVIVIGFSILCLSNFIPTISFGLLTGLAMTVALIGALILLPAMLVLVRPFRAGHS